MEVLLTAPALIESCFMVFSSARDSHILRGLMAFLTRERAAFVCFGGQRLPGLCLGPAGQSQSGRHFTNTWPLRTLLPLKLADAHQARNLSGTSICSLASLNRLLKGNWRTPWAWLPSHLRAWYPPPMPPVHPDLLPPGVAWIHRLQLCSFLLLKYGNKPKPLKPK